MSISSDGTEGVVIPIIVWFSERIYRKSSSMKFSFRKPISMSSIKRISVSVKFLFCNSANNPIECGLPITTSSGF